MSEQTLETVKRIKKEFERIQRETDNIGVNAAPLGDKQLTEKIKRANESAGEVVKHIETKTSPKGA